MSTRWWLRPPIADTWEDDASSMSSSRDLRQTALLEFMFTATPHSPRARRVQRLSIPSHSFQTSLDSYLHRVRSPPCHLHRLPSEILMDIFCYLPWSSRATRIHVTDPLPIWFDQEDRYYEGGDDDDDSEKAEAGSSYRGTVSRFCILNQLTRDGCDRFCGDYCRWDHLSILRVCRKWYNMAVGCPQFWCRILLHDERFTMRALQLSATLPLSVADIPDGYPLAPSAVLVALTALPRIRELHLPSRLGPDAKMAVLSALLSRPAPSLKLLHIESGYRPLERAFAGQTPSNLQQLVLLGSIPSSPDATIYAPTITSLQIEGRTPWTTANSICDVLSRMPLLEILILDARATVPDEIHSSSFTPPQQPLMLHNLRRLLLDQPFRAALNLQQIIQFPPSTSFELCYRHRCAPDPDAERCYLAQLGQYFEAVASDGHVVTRADFLVEYHCDTIELKLSTALSPPQRLPLSFRIQHVWRELADDFLPTLARLMQSTAATIPTTSIADLAIRQHTRTTDLDDSVTKYDAHLWWAFLLSIPAVRRLHLIWEAPKDFLFWLTANGQRAAYAQDVELYFPALEVLAISSCSLDEVAGIIAPVPDGHEDPAATEEQVSVFKLLTEFLQARERVGRLCLVDVLEQESRTSEVQRMIIALNETYGEGIVRRHRSLDEELQPLHLS